VLAGVIKSEPDWQALPPLPPLLETFLRQCLKKDPKRRLADMQDMRLALEGAFDVAAPQAASIGDAPPARRRIAVPGAILLLLAGAAAGWWLLGSGTSANDEVSRFEIRVSESGLDAVFGSAVILSPDGQTLAYATDDGVWVRRLDSAEPRRVVEEPVDNPVFSPDGQWIAYEQSRTLWRVPVTGGSPLRVADAPADRGTIWAEADTILMSPQARGAIVRVRIDGGGEPEPVTELQGDEVTHRWPQLLPGGRAVLFTAHVRTNNFDDANLVVRDLSTGDQRVVFSGGFYGRYVPTGHLVYANGAALFAVPFDLAGLTVTGPSVPVLEGVRANSSNGAAQYHFSDNGTLVYVPAAGDDLGGDSSGSWSFVDRDGTLEQSWATGGFSYGPALSPDGTRLVATVAGDEDQPDLWSWDRGRAAATRITFEEGTEVYPVWVPGGRELIFSANPDGTTMRLYRAHADGSGGREPLPDPHEGDEMPQSISADGRWLLTRTQGADDPRSLQVRDLGGSEAPRVVVTAQDSIHSAALSSDAAWIAYDSNESGDWEVYAVPFLAEDGNKVAVSVGGGGMPHWSSDGRSIFYRSLEGVMVVDMAIVDGRLQPAVPRTLFEGDFSGGVVGFPWAESGLSWFDAAADGETFVLRQETVGASQTNAIIVFNWFEELKRLAPVR
jgi:serine/threonine-protein kinase